MPDLRQIMTSDGYYGNSPIKISCVFHPDPEASLAIYPDHAHCYGCGKHVQSKEDLKAMIASYKGLDPIAAEDILIVLVDNLGKMVRPERTNPDFGKVKKLAEEYIYSKSVYFSERGLDLNTRITASLGYTGRAHTIPLYDRSKNLYWLKYRRDDSLNNLPTTPKYWRHPGLTGPILYFSPLVDWQGKTKAVITEGELDALLLSQYGIPAVSADLGVNSNKNYAFIQQLVKEFPDGLIVCFDQDTPGKKGASDFIGSLPVNYKSKLVQWPMSCGKDATDVVKAGKDKELVACLTKALAAL